MDNAPNGKSRKRYARTRSQPENRFASLISDQEIAIIPEFTLESGAVLRNVPVAYMTRGRLSAAGDNAMVICHALAGSADVADWWGPLLGGPGRAMDTSRFFVVCINCLGSPYGTASPMTNKNGDAAQGRYGPEFPLTTIRDDVGIQKLVLDDLGVRQVASVIGGSLGGMYVLEWAYLGPEYVRSIIPIATSSRHSAWCISWGEAQRQSIYADPKYNDGYYAPDDGPTTGLGAARMSALLTYRSCRSFESRFGRNTPGHPKRQPTGDMSCPSTPGEVHFRIHNDGHKSSSGYSSGSSPVTSPNPQLSNRPEGGASPEATTITAEETRVSLTKAEVMPVTMSTYFSAQSYLRYQAQKFVHRFDGNCYIAITRKMDTHDVSRNRAATTEEALALVAQPALVLGIESDGLFMFAESQELASHIPNARLERIESSDGHDAFLLQFEQVNRYILFFLRDVLPDIMCRRGEENVQEDVGRITRTSVFGEAEVEDTTAW